MVKKETDKDIVEKLADAYKKCKEINNKYHKGPEKPTFLELMVDLISFYLPFLTDLIALNYSFNKLIEYQVQNPVLRLKLKLFSITVTIFFRFTVPMMLKYNTSS